MAAASNEEGPEGPAGADEKGHRSLPGQSLNFTPATQ